MFSENDINDLDNIEEYDQEVEEDIRVKIVKNMIKNNRPIQHIMEDTGYTETEIIKLKEIIELIEKICTMNDYLNNEQINL